MIRLTLFTSARDEYVSIQDSTIKKYNTTLHRQCSSSVLKYIDNLVNKI